MARRYDSTRRQALAQARGKRILEAAAAQFIAQGWARTTIADVARAADSSPELVYRRFGSKAELLLEALRHHAFAEGDLRTSVEHLDLRGADGPDAAVEAIVGLALQVMPVMAPLIPVLSQAADHDERAAAAIGAMQHDRAGTTRIAVAGALDVENPPARVVEEVMVLTSAETYLQFSSGLGWTDAAYGEWLRAVVGEALRRASG